MHIDVNGTRLWFDVEGPVLRPDGRRMCELPTLLLVHGGPGGFDHSYFKPHFGHLADHAQVVYLDLRDHGRSARQDPAAWTFEACADDVAAFCDVLGIVRPIVLGHSMGGFVVMLYGARHPDHPAGLILQSTMARFDLGRVVEGFRTAAGDRVAALARRDYSGDDVSAEEWAEVFAAFGPVVPSGEELARRVSNPALNAPGMQKLRELDILETLPHIACPTLICVGDADPITPVAAAEEIAAALRPGVGRLIVIGGAGHFMWLDRPDEYRTTITEWLRAVVEDDHPRPVAGPGDGIVR
jgi:pimeloyl-ACP methyl ester carboxylesterase